MKQLDATARGVFLITVTPFTDDGALDLESTDRMVDFALDCGVTGLTVLGIMGEATKLTADESRVFVKRVLARVAGRVPQMFVLDGVPAKGKTADQVEAALRAQVLRIAREGVSLVVLTHRNHTRARARVRERTGALVAVHAADAPHARAQARALPGRPHPRRRRA